jgi:hypothetical protein
LFFNSDDALVPQDVNGTEDVYEYEPENVPEGSRYACSSASTSGSDVFEPEHEYEVPSRKGLKTGAGCVALISSGTSSEESAFLDASEKGGDVFFLTSAKLAPQDQDSAYDIYDAHECTSESPCISPVTSPPPCDTEASCKPSPESQPSIYGVGPSETFTGPGNLAGGREINPPVVPKKVTTKTVKCAKGKKLSHGKCVKVKNKKKKAKKASNGKGRA